MDTTQYKTAQTITPISAGIAGAILGAIGTAIALTLTDEEKKAQLSNTLHQLRTNIQHKVDRWVDKAQEVEEKGNLTYVISQNNNEAEVNKNDRN